MAEPASPARLEPARPEAARSAGKPAYAPRMPWKTVIAVVLGVLGIFAFYRVRQDRRMEALRQQMLDLHEHQLSEISDRYMSYRRRIETLVIEAAEGGEPAPLARVNLAGLRSGEGLYLRLRAENATSGELVRSAALGMERDAITRCLGLTPMSLRGLYARGDFLTPEWVEALRGEQEMMRLRVLEDQLGRHIQVDAPVVLSTMQADWFLLVIQRGENRRDYPVDVFLWDLRRDQQLLRARVQARGLLLPVQIRVSGQTTSAPGRPQVRSGAANDCSIASQLRALTGAPLVEFESGQAVIEAAQNAADEDAALEAAEQEASDDEPVLGDEGAREVPADG